MIRLLGVAMALGPWLASRKWIRWARAHPDELDLRMRRLDNQPEMLAIIDILKWILLGVVTLLVMAMGAVIAITGRP